MFHESVSARPKTAGRTHYRINEVFYSLQGEGVRAGTPNVFVRFSGCNLECRTEPGPKSPGGFDCDTEFASGLSLTLEELVDRIGTVGPHCADVILTGGEPALQADEALISALHSMGHFVAMETNGSVRVVDGIDWITVSPKVAEHAIRQIIAHEVKYVRGEGQAIPRPVCIAPHKLISPAFDGDRITAQTLDWCIQLVKENPEWRLSVQQHKLWKIR